MVDEAGPNVRTCRLMVAGSGGWPSNSGEGGHVVEPRTVCSQMPDICCAMPVLGARWDGEVVER